MTSRKKFKEDVEALSREIGVDVKEVHLRQMKRKWASCSTGGRLTFDPSLLGQPDETRLRAVLHELLHLRYPNHGRMFKHMLETYLRKAMNDQEKVKRVGCCPSGKYGKIGQVSGGGSLKTGRLTVAEKRRFSPALQVQ